MKAVIKICPSCNNEFQAERKNKTYCSDTCRAEVNNEKLREKMKAFQDLEKKSSLGDKYKTAYLSAIRIVSIKYNEMDSDYVNFEGKRFKYHSTDSDKLNSLGISLNGLSVKDGSQRIAVFMPSEQLLFFKTSIYSDHPFVFKMIQ